MPQQTMTRRALLQRVLGQQTPAVTFRAVPGVGTLEVPAFESDTEYQASIWLEVARLGMTLDDLEDEP